MIVGVHGVGQQQLGPMQLLRDWKPAILDGVIAANGVQETTGRAPADLAVDIAFYGGLFLPETAKARKDAAMTDVESLLEELDDDEEGELRDAIAEIVSEDEIAAAEVDDDETTSPLMKETRAIPPWLLNGLRAIDEKWGVAAGVLYLGELRQARRYLTESRLKDRVDEIVKRKMVAPEGGARILLGHSLGSVVAWEFVRQNRDHPLDLLVTFGSPLGVRTIRRRLSRLDGAREVPQRVGRWVNVLGAGDPVTFAGDLAAHWPRLDEKYVDNGRDDAHSACRYLSKAEIGSAIVDAMPGLRAG